MSVFKPNRVDPNSWWEFDETELIKCGECLNADLDKTARGVYVGDEVVTFDMVHELRDHEEEPYQCMECNKQSEGYDNLDHYDGDDLTYN